MHGIKTIHEINRAAEKINALRSTSVTDAAYEEIQRKRAERRCKTIAMLGEKTDEELISIVERALLGSTLVRSVLEEALARRLCKKIGRDFLA